ncbi:uncharacterized protein LTR77_010435 [Saxophila tyrrhenica]|uniref:Major facilitator superfamily (MFS) profile domain-containing protein n=1 Tax=Saxophila tyrrhenica TaxID=1690608 RepID=A0AAV9NVP2_9PEZI|nr:hypothetical protein LTR77_010435 [Saxophila tyrrhenica]
MEKHDPTPDTPSEKSSQNDRPGEQQVEHVTLEGAGFVEDRQRSRRLVRRMDLHILPLCAWIYLLNYLDRGNIGNSKVLNEETNDDLLDQTGTTASGYAVAVSLFSLAYFLFEVPSNWIMKRYVRPSIWLGTLLGCWGVFTIGFAGVQNYTTVVVLRFFIGVFEAGFFPGKCLVTRTLSLIYIVLSRAEQPYTAFLIPMRPAPGSLSKTSADEFFLRA